MADRQYPPLSNANENLRMKETVNPDSSISPNIETVKFDDFGVDLYPVSEATLSGLNLNVENKTLVYGVSPSSNTGVAARCFDSAVGGCPKHETSLISDSIPGVLPVMEWKRIYSTRNWSSKLKRR